MECASCVFNKTRGRAAYRKIRNGTFRCDDCNKPVCRLHANRDDGKLRCRQCAKAARRNAADQVRGRDVA